MSPDRFLADAVRAGLLLGLGLASMPLLRRAQAEARRLVLSLALAGALIVPAVSAIAPSWRVGAAPSLAVLQGVPFAEPLSKDAVAVAAAAPLAARRPPARASFSVDPASILAALWALGALLVVGRLAAGVVRGRAMVRRARPSSSWSRAAARAAHLTGVHPDVRMTDELDAPAVTGVFSPVVLVPRSSESWSDARRSAVLLHELAHVRARDCLVQILSQLACAVYWFDPLVWVAARRLRLERELAADDAVLAAGTRPSSYAEDLLVIAGARATPGGTLGVAEPSQLARRVAAIVSPLPVRQALSRGRASLLTAGAGTALLAVACATPEAPTGTRGTPTSAPSPAVAGGASTLDRRLQQIADEELDRTLAEWKASTGAVLVLDPGTGEILADAGRANGAAADVAVQRAFFTGSTLKAITLAAALDEGVVGASDRFDCGNGSRAYGTQVLHDSNPYGELGLPEMLAVSTNVGFSRVFDRLGGDRLGRWLSRFHFGVAPSVAGAAAGEMPARVADGSFEGAVAAIGQAMTASPLQLAAAYATLANDGAYVAPTMTHRAGPPTREQLVRPETARAVVSMLEGVVTGERATGKEARIAGVRVAGKTGTAEWRAPGSEGVYVSFVGIVPADHPRFVVLVGVEGPREGGYGGNVAAPTFARVASRALQPGGT
jgi:beta-lactamase regulating signal transducer with metallopeptidase domain